MEENPKSNASETSLLALFITPALYACMCILYSIALTISLNHHPYMHWNVLVAAFSTVTLALGFFPRQSIAYTPLLFIFTFWLALRTALSDYWNLVSQGTYTPIPFQPDIYSLSVVAHLLLGWLTFLRRFRSYPAVFVISVLVVVITGVVPKPKPDNEYLTMFQAIAYVVLYLFSNVVAEIYSLEEGRSTNAAIKVLQSSWALLVENSVVITIMTALQCLISIGVLWVHHEKLPMVYQQMRRPMSASVAHSGVPSTGKHSEDETGNKQIPL